MMRLFQVDLVHQLRGNVHSRSDSKVPNLHVSDPGQFFHHEPWREVKWNLRNSNEAHHDGGDVIGGVALLHAIEEAVPQGHVQGEQSFQRPEKSVIHLSVLHDVELRTFN